MSGGLAGVSASLVAARALRTQPAVPLRAPLSRALPSAQLPPWTSRRTALALAVAATTGAAAAIRSGTRGGRRRMAAAASASGRPRRVAVIGAGPAGVVSCRQLVESGHDPVVFEAGTEVGGIWAPSPTNKVVYAGLVTNIPKVCMQSFDLDFPASLPSYVRAEDLGRYVASYADHFNLRPRLRFRSRVSSVEALTDEDADAAGAGRWRVRWSDGAATASTKGGGQAEPQVSEAEFDAVVVASGHYDTPYVPEIPGQAEWLRETASTPGARTVSHSRDYHEPGQFAGRVVLVVGGRSSAVDIARELNGVAKWVYVLDKGCEQVQTRGACTHVPPGSALRSDGHVRPPPLQNGDGEADAKVPGPPVQDVVLATGYTYSFPFLDEQALGLDFGPVRRFVAPLYMHVVHSRRPSLCFVGIPLAVPCPIPLFEAQARFMAAHLLDVTSTSTAERDSWVDSRRQAVGPRLQDMHFLGADAWQHTRELTRRSRLLSAEALAAYERRLALVEAVYRDRVSRKPELPWDDDCYRRCEYDVDWDAGTWRVSAPAGRL